MFSDEKDLYQAEIEKPAIYKYEYTRRSKSRAGPNCKAEGPARSVWGL
jgi:hypothetical protein